MSAQTSPLPDSRIFRVNLNSFYTRRDIDWIPNGDNAEGLLFNVSRGAEGETPDNNDAAVLDLTQDQVINHFNTSANIDWSPMDNMRHRLTFGLDLLELPLHYAAALALLEQSTGHPHCGYRKPSRHHARLRGNLAAQSAGRFYVHHLCGSAIQSI